MILINRLLGLLLGLGLVAAGVIVIAEVALGLAGQVAWLIDRTALDTELSHLTWADPRVLPSSAGLLTAGVVLVIAQLKPRRPATLPLPHSNEHRRDRIERRGVEARLASVARGDDEVVDATARVGRRRARVKARAAYGTEATAVRERIRTALSAELSRIDLQHKLEVRTKAAKRPGY